LKITVSTKFAEKVAKSSSLRGAHHEQTS